MKKILFFKKGFTLAEAIIAAAVLTIGVVAIIQVFPTSIKTSSTSRKTTEAINLAQAAIERTISNEFGNIISIAPQRVSNDPQNPFYDFYQQIDVVFVDQNLNISQNDTGLKKITATISWTEQGSQKNVTVPTLISRK
jgi:Tfp pilus assembly protein PilV